MTNGNKPPGRKNGMPDETRNETPDEMPDEGRDQAEASMPPRLSGIILDEQTFLTLGEISQACAVRNEYIVELVEEGLITPVSTQAPKAGPELSPLSPEAHEAHSWRFTGMHMRHARIASHLQSDLGINLAGVALALQLLDEVEALRTRLKTIGVQEQ